LIDDRNDTRKRQLNGATEFKETTMTVRAILDTKGHHSISRRLNASRYHGKAPGELDWTDASEACSG